LRPDDAADPLSARTTWWLLGALVAVQVVLLAPLFRPGEPLGDDLSIHFSECAQLARALRGGDLAWWNPGGNLGFPSGYYYQVVPQLVPALVKLALPPVPLLVLFKLGIALPLLLTPLTCYRALRVAGVDAARALGGAMAVSCVLGASQWGLGADSMFVTGLYTQAWAILFYPLALAYGARYLGEGTGVGRAAGYAVLAGLCHPFIAFCLAPALALTPWWRAGVARAALRAGILLAAVLAATAFFWLPILVHHDSFGGFPARLASESGIAPARFAGWLLRARFLDEARVPVLTLGVLGACVLAWWRRGVLALLLAQGALFGLLVMVGPLVGKVKDDLIAAVRFLAPMQLAWAAAAGMAWVDGGGLAWRRLARTRRPGLRWSALAGGMVALAIVLGTAVGSQWDREQTARDFKRPHREELGELMTVLGERPRGRMLGGREWGTGSHWWLYLPFAYQAVPPLRVWGGAPLQSSPNFVYLREDRKIFQHARLYGLRYALTGKGFKRIWPEGQVTAATANYQLMEVAGQSFLFAPVRTGARIAAAGRRAEVKRWLASPAAAAGEHLQIGGPAGAPAGPPAALVLSEREGLSRYDAEVAAATPTRFALRVSFHPQWRAWIDGVRAPVVRLSPDILAVDVPAGRHRLAFVFTRPWWTWVLMAATLLGFAGHGLLRWRGGSARGRRGR